MATADDQPRAAAPTPLLFDEAVYRLTEQLESLPRGTLTITVENGWYSAALGDAEGDWKPVLTDALNSLIEAVSLAVLPMPLR